MEIVHEQPSPREQQVRQWAVFLHLSQLAGILVPFAGYVVPFIIWQTKKDEMPELDIHGKVVANWVISAVIYSVVCGILTILLIGLPMLFLLAILGFIFPIIGALKANNGEVWKYPLSLQLLK